MMHGSLLRLLGFGCTLVLAGACANGDDPSNSGFSITGVSNPTQAGTNPTSESASSTGTPTTGDAGSTTAPASTSGEDASTTNPASGTTTTTGVDPSTTTTTGVDPSTSTTDNTTGTTGEPPPPPPPKDNQPVAGLYEACLDNTPCDVPPSDGCFTLTDANMKVTDGYCTALCDTVVDCGTKPVCPAVQECLNIAVNQNVCALKCAGVKDCPTGMACINISLPNNMSGMYCF